MHWSEAAITWGREDHPRLMPSPGEYALVLDPVICSDTHTCRFSRVLIDGGSSINLLYRSSMEKLGIPLAQLKPSRLTFHGVMPGHSCTPMSKVQLEVLFGEKGNSRREPIWFEVVDISSPCHALLGRPALAKFMAVSHYAYLKMKLLGPRGVITISGSFKKSLACAKESSQLAEALVIVEEKRHLLHHVELTQQDVPARQSPVEQFKRPMRPRRSCWRRVIPPSTSSSAPTFLLNIKASSPASSMRIGTSSHGLQKTCQVCRGSWLSTHSMSGRMPSWLSNHCGTLQNRKGKPSVRRLPGSSQPASSWRYSTLTS
jgi:hypothetical protein